MWLWSIIVRGREHIFLWLWFTFFTRSFFTVVIYIYIYILLFHVLWMYIRFINITLLVIKAWNSNTNRNEMQQNSFIKVYWTRHGLEIDRDSLQTKSRNVSCYQTSNLLKTWFLFLVCKKKQKEDKSEFVTKSVEIIVTIIFI